MNVVLLVKSFLNHFFQLILHMCVWHAWQEPHDTQHGHVQKICIFHWLGTFPLCDSNNLRKSTTVFFCSVPFGEEISHSINFVVSRCGACMKPIKWAHSSNITAPLSHSHTTCFSKRLRTEHKQVCCDNADKFVFFRFEDLVETN